MNEDHQGNPQTLARGDEISSDFCFDHHASNEAHRDFRRAVETLTDICALILRQRDCCGSYLGVSGPQYTMISALGQSGGVTVTELARKLHVSSSFIAVEVRKLIDLGFVEKRPNPHDARSVVLEISARGRNALTRLKPLRQEMEELMYRSLGHDEIGMLQHIMDRLVVDARAALRTFAKSINEQAHSPDFGIQSGSKPRLRSARVR